MSHDFFDVLLVLTDGMPSESGVNIPDYVARQLHAKPIYGALSTFGFGYSLDTRMLKDIALEGNGTFSFIPDATMVGTVFVNAMSNMRCIYGV